MKHTKTNEASITIKKENLPVGKRTKNEYSLKLTQVYIRRWGQI